MCYCTCMEAMNFCPHLSQILGVFVIQFSSYHTRMYLSITCIQDKYHFMILLIFNGVSISLNMEHSEQLESGTSINITTGCLSCLSSYLKSLREATKLKENFSSFDLDIETRRNSYKWVFKCIQDHTED